MDTLADFKTTLTLAGPGKCIECINIGVQQYVLNNGIINVNLYKNSKNPCIPLFAGNIKSSNGYNSIFLTSFPSK